MPPEHHLTAQAWTGDVSECAGWFRGQGEAGRKVLCSMQAYDWVHRFPQFKLKGIKIFVFNDAMTGHCWERVLRGCESPCLTDRCEQVEGLHARANARAHTHTHTRTHTYTHTHSHTHTNTHARAHAHTHARTNKHTHTHTHTCISVHKAHTSCQFTAQKASPTFQHRLRCFPPLVFGSLAGIAFI